MTPSYAESNPNVKKQSRILEELGMLNDDAKPMPTYEKNDYHENFATKQLKDEDHSNSNFFKFHRTMRDNLS